MKVLLFAHEQDIDGIGSVILGKIAFKNLDYVPCKTFEIDKFNEAPTGDEISVYFSYYTKPNANEPVLAKTPSTDSYIVESQERGYATSSTQRSSSTPSTTSVRNPSSYGT